MKRFYKFLMPLVAIVAMALPWNARAQVTVNIGDGGTTTNSYLPMYTLYNNTLSEQIYTASEIGMPGLITSIAFYNGGSEKTPNVKIYMINTTESSFSSTTAWLPVTASDLVFDGTVTFTAGQWTTITLDNPFMYDGASNLGLIFDGNMSWSSGLACRVFSSTSNCAMYVYSDGTDYNAVGATYSASSRLSVKNQIQLGIMPADMDCYPVRNITASNIGPWSCTLSWSDTNNAGASYTVISLPDSTVLASGISDTTVDLTNLLSDHNYTFGVYADCGGDGESMIVNTNVHTLVSCPPPTALTVDSVTTSDISLHWTPGYEEAEWYLSIGDSLIGSVTDTFYTISDLNANTVYTIYLRAVCGVDDSSVVVSTHTRTLPGEPVSEFPYTCDFEDADENAGWVLENGSQPNAWYIGTAVNNGGTNSLYVSNSNGTTNAYGNTTSSHVYAYRYINFSDTGSYAFSFDWRCQGESNYYDYLRAWIAPASVNHVAGDGSTYNYSTLAVPGCIDLVGANSNGQYTLAGSSNFTTHAGEFRISTPGTYKLVFLWSNDGSGGSNPPAAVDNVFINTNSCPAPYNLTATYVGTDTIELSWTAGGDEASWLVTVNGGTPESVTSNPLTLDGLNANTAYNINVQAECGGDDVSIPAAISVRTACGTINLPFSEDFTGMASSSYPDCWTRVMSGSYPYITTSYGNSIQFAGTAAVIAPYINAPLNQMIVSFDLRKEGSSSGPMTFGYTSDPVAASDMVVLHTIDPSTTATYFTYEYDLSLDSAVANLDPDSVYYLVWRQNGSTAWYYWLDNVNIEQYNPCTKPQNFTCTSTQPDSVVVTWNAGDASSWELYVGPAGVPVNEDSAFAVTDSVYVFTNLQGGVAYNFYVRTDCGDDYSNWAGPLAVTPGQYIIGTSGSATISMCGGVIYDDGGPNGQYSNSADFTLTINPTHPDSMLTFQGWAYTESSIDYLRIYEGTSPSGTILWQTSTSSQLDNIPYTIVTSGPITLKWHTDGSVVYDGFELQIGCMAAPECSPVDNLAVYPTPTAALVTWQPGYYGNYTGADIEYKADTADTWISLPSVTGTYAVITGLDPLTDYNVRVTTDCDGFPGGVAMATFSSTDFPCEVFDTAGFGMPYQIGNGTGTSYYLPIGNYYNYSYTQQLYLASEFNGAMPINGIDFQYAYGSSNTAKTNVTIYMANVSATSLSNGFVPYDASTFVPVYTGSLACTSGWNHFDFTTPFNYDGSSNLLLVVHDNSGDYDGTSYVFSTTPCASGLGRYVQNDGSAYSINTVSGGTSLAYRANVKFSTFSCLQSSTCAAPAVAVTDVTTTTVTVAWAPGSTETSWELSYRLYGTNNWSTPVTVTGSSYTVTGLSSGMPYEFKVEHTCNGEATGSSTNATTLCAQISSLPFTENFNGWGTGVTPNCWSNQAGYSPTSYGIISSSYNHSGSTGGSIYMYSSSGNSVTYLALPELDTTVYQPNQLQLVFNLFYNSTSYSAPQVEVGVMTNQDNSASFVPVDTVTHSGALATWEIFEVPLTNYTGNGSYVAIRTNYPGSYSYFYLDDVTLEQIPTCPRPDSLTASNATTNSVDLAWHERASASQWIIEYGPRGFQLGTGTTVVVNSNPFTLTGLPSSFQGEYYVKSICGVGDTGEYSRTGCAFGTTQIPATLPYDYDFENAAEWQNWQTSSNHETNNWYRGTSVADSGSYSIYVATGDAASYYSYSFNAVVNAAAYRDIDFGPVDSSYTITFRARAGGTTDARYDALMVFLVDPSLPTVPSTSNITSPWGNVNDLYRIATIYLDTTWQTYEASFDTISGIHRVAFFWFNQNTGASNPNIPQPAAVDNIHIKYSSCTRPVNVQVTPGATTAQVSWQGDANANYQVIYRPYPGNFANTYVTTMTNHITLNGLSSSTQYAVWVRKLCGVGDTSLTSDGELFTTTLCDNATMATTGAATSTNYYTPLNNFYNYTFTETIIDSAELADLGGDISTIAYSYNYTTASSAKTNVTIWLQPTTKTEFSGTSDVVALDTTTAVQVYSGPLNCSQGWNYFGFTTPYSWDGHSNLLVIVDDNSGDYDGSSYVFDVSDCSGYKTIYYYSDTYNCDPLNPGSFSGSKNYVQYRATMQLISCGASAPCAEPAIDMVNTTVEETSVTLVYSGDAAQYEIGRVVGSNWIDPAVTYTTSNLSYTLTGLTGETQYTIGVRALCGGSRMSDWNTVTITTQRHPCAVPTNVTVTDPTYDGATVSWTAGEAENEWEVRVFCASPVYDTTIAVSDNTTVTVTGLDDDVTYSVAVRAVCAADWKSAWSDTVALTTVTCPQVTGVNATNLTATSATISWTPTGVSTYEVEYGTQGFQVGTGVTVTSTTNSVNLTGLEEQTRYNVYVRGYCTDEVSSVWSEVCSFITPESNGIADVESGNVTLYPNPASTMVTIAGIEGEAMVSVVDLNGREVYKTNASESVTIDVSGYAKGAYFVRITGERTTAIRKLVVK